VDQPRRFGSRVFVQDVGTTLSGLRKTQPNLRILAQKEAIEVWTPLYDKTVSLFLETLDGKPPTLMVADMAAGNTTTVVGGSPCRVFPEGWGRRARQLLDDFAAKRRVHRLCGKPERKNENFFQLRQFLTRCVDDPDSLSQNDVARIRLLVARCVARRGLPGAPEFAAIRARQTQQTHGPTFQQISQVVAGRLSDDRFDSGIEDVEPVLHPVTLEEAAQHQLSSIADIPNSIRRKVERCLTETADELVRRGIITSGEALARVLPQVTSGIHAAGIADPSLRHLCSAVYRAFRRRRSLLLLNLESQVRVDELPWVAAIDRFRRRELTASYVARETLRETAILTLRSFPQAIVPNKLLQELRELAKQANLELPLVDELAADIFMGQFTGKFVSAARQAGRLLANSLYATYYDIDYASIQRLPDNKAPSTASWFHRRSTGETGNIFATLCRTRAGVATGGWDVAVNGMIVEQQQILTTQNLAVLVSGLDLVPDLALAELARRCFEWICKRHQKNPPTWHALLIVLKNTAYAWRQMIFYLSLLPLNELNSFLAWADQYFAQQPAEFQRRFRPAVEGLRRAATGRSPEEGDQARRFLGWTKERHWLLGPKPQL
jgi:hypothetical protein